MMRRLSLSNTSPLFILAIAALALGLLMAGCGGDDSNGSGQIAIEGSSLSKQQFIEKADAICQRRIAEAHEDFEAFVKRTKLSSAPPSKLKKLGNEVAETVIAPPLERQIDEIREIGAPVGDENRVAAILTVIEEALEEGKAEPSEIISGAVFSRSGILARKYGLAVCGTV
jgi:hypothetical protein